MNLRDIIRARSVWYSELVTDGYTDEEVRREVRWPEDANLVGSLMAGLGSTDDSAYHYPVLDLDFEAKLVPSSTKGHYHLYLERMISWKKYKKLLKALADADILEKEYVDLALKRKGTFVRLPGETKEKEKSKPKKERLNRYCHD